MKNPHTHRIVKGMELHSWKAYALGAAFFAALTAIFGKLGVSGVDSNFATWIRTIVVLVFLSLMLFFIGFKFSTIQTLSRHQLLFLFISGLCTGLSWLCYYKALQLGPASKVAPVDKLSVALAIILAWIFLGEKITWGLVLGASLIVSGTLVVLFAGF